MNVRQVYAEILNEMKSATYDSVAIDPETFVKDRLPPGFLAALEDPRALIVLHCTRSDGETQQRLQKAVNDARKGKSGDTAVTECSAKLLKYNEVEFGRDDFPVHVHEVTAEGFDPEYHITNLDGETWVKQMLYILAAKKVPLERLKDVTLDCGLESRIAAVVKELLTIPLNSRCTSIESLTIGTKGLIPMALERVAIGSKSYKETVARVQLERLAAKVRERVQNAQEFDAGGTLKQLKAYAENRANAAVLLGEQASLLQPGILDKPDGTDFQAVAKQLALNNKTAPYFSELFKKIQDCKDLKSFRKLLADMEKSSEGWDAIQKTLASADATPEALAKLPTSSPDLMKTRYRKQLEAAQGPKLAKDAEAALRQIMEGGASAVEKVALATRTAELGGDAELLRALQSNPTGKELEAVMPQMTEVAKNTAIPGQFYDVQGKGHVLVSVTDAHGDLSYHLVKQALKERPDLRINFFGTCGSYSDQVGVAQFIAPTGNIQSIEPGARGSIPCKNLAKMPDASPSSHSSVCTLLQEHDAAVKDIASRAQTVDMETYHISRAVAESGVDADVRILMRVSDIVTSKTHGAQSKELQALRDPAFDGKMDQVVQAFGMIDKDK